MRRRLLAWHARASRDFFWRDGRAARPLTPFQVLLVEFLLWKTNAARSEAAILRIVERLKTPAAVRRRSVASLEGELRPLGLHRRRARCLAALCRQLGEGGDAVPSDPVALQRLTGVGQYAARATACLLAGSRLMPVDTNTSRIFGRLFGEEGPGVRTPSAAWDARMDAFVPSRNPKRFLWSTMDLAAALCTPRDPRCGACPVAADCAVGRERLAVAAASSGGRGAGRPTPRAARAAHPRAAAPIARARRASAASRS